MGTEMLGGRGRTIPDATRSPLTKMMVHYDGQR